MNRSRSKDEDASSNNIHVCVRVRPFAAREKGETLCVKMPTPTQVSLIQCEFGDVAPSDFNYDHAYWSFDKDTYPDRFCRQETLMTDLGNNILQNAQQGYNGCLFAYGQTGSGKTHSVLGSDAPSERGLMPRILEKFFADTGTDTKADVMYVCKVSYLEIYNEHIKDLLMPATSKEQRKFDVRTHPKLGVIIPGLSVITVSTYPEVKNLIDFGIKSRSVASTNMNATSSRSHCILTFDIEKSILTEGKKSELRSKINLVDLAGSERVKKTKAEGSRLKEGAAINQSLSALAAVIRGLAEESQRKVDTRVRKQGTQPTYSFRNSTLTRLLEMSLSGNSKTVMMAAISPASSNYEESLSTLRFATLCKSVVTHAKKNEESKESIMKDMQSEIARLKAQIDSGDFNPELHKQLEAGEYAHKELAKSAQELIQDAKEHDELRKQALEDMGLSMEEIKGGFNIDPNTPQLLNISEDPSLTGSLVYFLVKGEKTTIGAGEACKIRMVGLGCKPYMCQLINEAHSKVTLVMLTPKGDVFSSKRNTVQRATDAVTPEECGRVLINGKLAGGSIHLKHLDRLIFGHACCFRLMIPLKANDGNAADEDRTLEDALREIVRDDSPEFKDFNAMFDSIQDRIGESDAQAFLNDFKHILPLVDEGNAITKEMRPHEFLRFQVEVATDCKTYLTDMPEFVVRLYKRALGEDTEEVLDIFEFAQYVHRLEDMRHIHDDFLKDRRKALENMKMPGCDPWLSYKPADIKDLMQSKHTEIEELEDLVRQLGYGHKLAQLPSRKKKDKVASEEPQSPSKSNSSKLWLDTRDDGRRNGQRVKFVMPYSTRDRGSPDLKKTRSALRGFHV